jgi:hypothetical protein
MSNTLSNPVAAIAESVRDVAEFDLRPVEPADDDAARIVYEAFGAIHDPHALPPDFPTLEAAAALTRNFIAHPSIWGVVALRDGRIIGSNFVDERGQSEVSDRSPSIRPSRSTASAAA